MHTPPYTPVEQRDRETFLALMWALSYPGSLYTLPAADDAPLAVIAAALLDLETSFFTPDPGLQARLAQTGARALPPERAAYHFYPALTPADMPHVAAASPGSMLYPDRAATLFIGCALDGDSPAFALRGPGISGAHAVRIGGLPADFWSQRQRAMRFPLGWDVFLVDGLRVLGLPRTTAVEGA